jgi:hypothetical protein
VGILPEIMLLDLNMPGGGIESAREISTICPYIPRSRHNPKILWVDDAEIVGDRIAEVGPIPWHFFAQKTKRRIGELGASCVGFIVGDVSVHEAP